MKGRDSVFYMLICSLLTVLLLLAVESYADEFDSSVNLALGATAVASSIESSEFEATRAVDGQTTSRWASAESDDQWIYVDLGSVFTIDRILLNWETAYGAQYQIQVSTDAVEWNTVFTENSGNGDIDDISFSASEARYVRMNGIQRGTIWGYSLYEFEVYASATPRLTTMTIHPSNATCCIYYHTTLYAVGYDQFGNRFPLNDGEWVSWSVTGGGYFDDWYYEHTGRFIANGDCGQYTVQAQKGTVTATATIHVVDTYVNSALGAAAVASSIENSDLQASMAVDGQGDTRWASAESDDQWIYVDLGSILIIDRVLLNWEAAYGAQYEIQVSTNATDWNTVFTENSGDGGIDDISFTPVEARYVRMNGLQRGTIWGYSLYELEVHQSTRQLPYLAKIVISPSDTGLHVGEQQEFSVAGYDQYRAPFTIDAEDAETPIFWSASGGGSIDAMGVFKATVAGGPFAIRVSSWITGNSATIQVFNTSANAASGTTAVASSMGV